MSFVAVVFTFKDIHDIALVEGSQSWKTDLSKAREATHVVMTRNGRHRGAKSGDKVPHRAAFAVGRVVAIVPSDERDGRWKFKCDAIARLDPPKPEIWEKGRRYPVHYTTFEDLGINIDELKFEPLENYHSKSDDNISSPRGALTIEAAKIGLAKTFKVKPEQIEITVRG